MSQAASSQATPTQEKIRLQLKWFNQFQFAGYYAAVEQGYYASEGLEVEIVERDLDKSVVKQVISGEANYGVGDAGLLSQFAQGEPMIALAAIFQHNPLVFFSRQDSGIISPYEMAGKRIMSDSLSANEAPLRAMLAGAKISEKDFTLLQQINDYSLLTQGKVDVIAGYISDQSYYFKQQGVKVNIISPQNYGIDFYGDMLFTSQQELRDYPERTHRFLRASLKGWQYALDHPEQLVQIIHQKYKSRLSIEHLRFEAEETRKLIAPDAIPLGQISLNRLKAIVHLQVDAGLKKTISDDDLSAFIYNLKDSTINLTEQEQTWLNAHHLITVGIDPDFAPYESIDANGHYVGMVADYLDLIEEKLGVKFEIHGDKSWAETLNMGMHGELDMLSSAVPTPERSQHLIFVKPFKSSPIVIIDSGRGEFIGKLENLQNKRVVVEKGYFMEEMLKTQHPNIRLLVAESTKEALNLIAAGKADAYVGDAGITNYIIKELGLLNLRFSGQTPYSSQQSIAVYKDNVELASIMNKAMEAISPEKNDAILNHWLGLNIKEGINTKTMVKYGLGIMAAFLLFFVWVIKLRKEIKLRKQAEQTAIQANRNTQNVLAAASEVAVIATDNQGVIRVFNRGAEHMLGYSAVEIVDQTTPMLIHLEKEVTQRAQELSDELGYKVSGIDVFVTKANLKAWERREWTYVRKDGSHLTVSLVVSAVRSVEGEITGYLGIAQDITARKLLEHNLKQEADRHQKIANQLPGVIYQYQLFPDGRACFPYASDGLYEIYEVSPEQIYKDASTLFAVVHPDDYDMFVSSIQSSARTMMLWEFEYRVILPIKGARWLSGRARPELLGDNSILWHGFISDITERKQSEENLKLAASVFTHAREGIMITDAAGTIIEVNDTFTQITGYSREEVIGQNPRILQSGRQSPEFYTEMWQAINTTDHWIGEVWNRRKNGEVYPENLTISVVNDAAGKVSHYVALFSDITRIKEHQSQLEWMANYDVLTSLPNRTLLADRLSQAMVQSQRHHNSVAVVFLDLDGFKDVNDSHGHIVGDELLIIASLRMKEALREGDTLARIGGDEFVAVLADLTKVEDCQPVLERLLLSASRPVTIGEIKLQVSTSIGVTLYPQDGADAEILMRHADQAMYLAKQAGKNRYHLFDTAHDNAVKTQRESIGDIKAALDRREFVLFYQPKVNMHTGDVIGVEALIRWQHPVRGLLSPIQFLPVIEDHTISLDLGEWVIDAALTQISQWQSAGITLPISVNISAYQLQQTNFVSRLTALLAAHPDVSSQNLELEVLETSALDDVIKVSATMNSCRDLGVSFALDDFGTGYSSLTYLRRLPASLIKIDQSFVRDMLEDPDDLAIVEGVISLATAFQRKVIAEGVETIAHGTTLIELGCDLAQGYGIAKPMPAREIPAWLDNWKPDDAWLT
ncbi:MAG: diguanylate cyclase (GGDEF)-like protein/PAS domain S-box-containing protein [Methylophagaceae bacterium]